MNKKEKIEKLERQYQESKTPEDRFIKHLIKIISTIKTRITEQKLEIENNKKLLYYYRTELAEAKERALNYYKDNK